jgi:2-polyprenyl-6-methoxyphenol hydroxylase-like FAD-dependent oxidoreductase
MFDTEASPTQVVVIGAGPIGMTAALELARHGIRTVVFDEDDKFADGSRAIAMHGSILDVFERSGALTAIMEKAVVWTIRRTYHRDRELVVQHLPAPDDGRLPTYINLQQNYTEQYLYQRIADQPLIDLRWKHRVVGLAQDDEGVILTVDTPEGQTEQRAEYVVACDGARSLTRKLLGLEFPGHSHADAFLIVDIRADLPFERQPCFFFDHSTNPGSTILIHPQPDGVWRIDWQVGANFDLESELAPNRMDARIRSFIGDVPYEIVWLSSYRFHQRLLERFQHGRVFFTGDAAHLVAPFGARGMNSGVLDVENLAWKLALVLGGSASPALLESYDAERWPAQKENQVVTDRTMKFMVPPNGWHRLRRKAVFTLCQVWKGASRWVDSGKMAHPFVYTKSPLTIANQGGRRKWPGVPRLGEKVPDAACACWKAGDWQPIRFRHIVGAGFLGLYFAPANGLLTTSLPQGIGEGRTAYQLAVVQAEGGAPSPGQPEDVIYLGSAGELAQAFGAQPGDFFLIRPDGHLTGRLRPASEEGVAEMFERLIEQYHLRV